MDDLCRAFGMYAKKILKGEMRKEEVSLSHKVIVCWPEPITILELAQMVREAIVKYSKGETKPEIEIVNKGKSILFTPKDKNLEGLMCLGRRVFLGWKE